MLTARIKLKDEIMHEVIEFSSPLPQLEGEKPNKEDEKNPETD